MNAHPTPGSKFFQFHAVLAKIWPPLAPKGLHPHLGKILDPPLGITIIKMGVQAILEPDCNRDRVIN